MSYIPKLIHNMWLDKHSKDGPPPEKYLNDPRFIQSVKSMNPDFEYKLWNSEMIDQLFDENESVLGKYRHFYYHEIRKHIEKCDFSRYCVLLIHGGIYCDLDMECKRPLNTLIAGREFVCIQDWHDYGLYTIHPHIFNGFLGCAPGHSFMQHLLDAIMYRYQSGANVFQNTGPVTLGTLAVKLGYLKPQQGHKGKFIETLRGAELFVNPCLIMPQSDMHSNKHCANIDNEGGPYVYGHWKDGTGWMFTPENLKELIPQTVERFHQPIIMVLFILLVVLLVYSIVVYRKHRASALMSSTPIEIF